MFVLVLFAWLGLGSVGAIKKSREEDTKETAPDSVNECPSSTASIGEANVSNRDGDGLNARIPGRRIVKTSLLKEWSVF